MIFLENVMGIPIMLNKKPEKLRKKQEEVGSLFKKMKRFVSDAGGEFVFNR